GIRDFHVTGVQTCALPILETDALLAEHPGDPYFRELKGQMLLEHGRVAESVPEYEAAVRALPASAQIRQALAKAQIALDTREAEIGRASCRERVKHTVGEA